MVLFPTAWLLAVWKLASCKSHYGRPCFVARYSRSDNRRPASSMLLMGREIAMPSEIDKRNRVRSRRRRERTKQKTNGDRDEAHRTKLKMNEAQLVEKLLFDAVNKMNRSNNHIRGINGINLPPSKLFPSVRACNAALATFGDAGE